MEELDVHVGTSKYLRAKIYLYLISAENWISINDRTPLLSLTAREKRRFAPRYNNMPYPLFCVCRNTTNILHLSYNTTNISRFSKYQKEFCDYHDATSTLHLSKSYRHRDTIGLVFWFYQNTIVVMRLPLHYIAPLSILEL